LPMCAVQMNCRRWSRARLKNSAASTFW
jgi:hypothetical protein